MENGRLESFGKCLDDVWQYKKRMSEHISNPFIDDVYNTAISSGAIGGKISALVEVAICFFIVHTQKTYSCKSFEKKGIITIDYNFTFEGLETWSVDD